MKIEAVRKFHFCAGHRVHMHESKCANLHGHNYILYVFAEAPELDALGRVIDFSILKSRIEPWIDANWDHTFLIFDQDLEMLELEKIAPKNRPWYLCPFNPTAENMAIHLMRDILPRLLQGTSVKIARVELEETQNCRAVISEAD